MSAYGAIRSSRAGAGETITLDTGHVVAFDDTVQYTVRKAGSWKSTILGGEGLVTDFTGPGRVWLQTRSSSDLDRLDPEQAAAVSAASAAGSLRGGSALPVGQDALFLVLERSDEDHDEVDERPDPEEPQGDEHQNPGAHLAHVEAVDAEDPEEPRKQAAANRDFGLAGRPSTVSMGLPLG